MRILGLQGSPRKKGNTFDLWSMFAKEAGKYGAQMETILPHTLDINPCKELVVCEKKGFCPIKDEMDSVYAALKTADIIVLASPVFFYNVPAQLKALIDRCQMFWARKYRLYLKDPNADNRQGLLLSCGGSGGKKLFEGLELTAKIFFDALSARYQGALTFRHVESPGDMAAHPTAKEQIRETVKKLCQPFAAKPQILFVSAKDAFWGQMAAAFLRFHGKGRIMASSAGWSPAGDLDSRVVSLMAKKNLDLKYLKPKPLDNLVLDQHFDIVVYLDKNEHRRQISADRAIVWEMNHPSQISWDELERTRDDLESRIQVLISSFQDTA